MKKANNSYFIKFGIYGILDIPLAIRVAKGFLVDDAPVVSNQNNTAKFFNICLRLHIFLYG